MSAQQLFGMYQASKYIGVAETSLDNLRYIPKKRPSFHPHIIKRGCLFIRSGLNDWIAADWFFNDEKKTNGKLTYKCGAVRRNILNGQNGEFDYISAAEYIGCTHHQLTASRCRGENYLMGIGNGNAKVFPPMAHSLKPVIYKREDLDDFLIRHWIADDERNIKLDAIVSKRNLRMARRNHPLFSKAFGCWKNLRKRCGKAKGYENATICEEWQHFDAFFNWFVANYPKNAHLWLTLKGTPTEWHIDKDLKVLFNQHYSPETCCLVPAIANQQARSQSLDVTKKGRLTNRLRRITELDEKYGEQFPEIIELVENHLQQIIDFHTNQAEAVAS